MSLRFIIGSAGAGKTQLCIEELAAACTQQPLGSRIIYILPQQATFLHEKMLADACPGGGFCRVEVSSFTRLIQRVYRHSGADLPPSLSESGKLLLMHAVAAGRSSELNVFSAVCHSSGFDAQMVSIAEEMQSYGVTPEQVLAVAEYLQEKNSNSRLAAKLQEIALLYADYARIVTEGYSSHAQRLHFLAQYIRAQDWQHTQIYIDGYDEFTPAELEVVAAMVAGCQRVNVCLCMDTALTKRRVREEEVFYTSWQTYHALNHVAQQEQIEIEPLCLLDGSKGRFAQNPDLRSVEHVFSGHREAAKEHVPQGLQLSCAVDKRSELLAAGREIVRLVREEGLRYRDISLIFRDANDYDHLLAEVFESLDIPYFVDSKKSLFYHPLVEMLRCALELWAYRPHYRHIMRLAKNVFSPLSAKEADVLDNYCLAHGVKFYHWNNDPWSFPLLDDENEETLSQVNELRERLFIAVQDMIALPVDAVSAAELNAALNAFMEKIAAVDILQQLQEQAVEQGHSELASSYAQVWDILQNFFDESQLLLGDTCFDAAQLQELYDAALRGLTFSTIPPGLDQILISSLERSRLPRLKAAMVLGCNDGTLPRRVAMDGLLRDDERVLLAEHGVMLAPGSVQRQFRENYISN